MNAQTDPAVIDIANHGTTTPRRDLCHVFFSYRHTDNQILVQSVWRHLTDLLPGWQVFLDLDGLDLGAELTTILERLSESTVVFAFVGPKWHRDSDDPEADDDWVLLELDTAVRLGKTIVPIFHSGGQAPRTPTSRPGMDCLKRTGLTIGESHSSLCAAVERMRQHVLKKVHENEQREHDAQVVRARSYLMQRDPTLAVESPVPQRRPLVRKLELND